MPIIGHRIAVPLAFEKRSPEFARSRAYQLPADSHEGACNGNNGAFSLLEVGHRHSNGAARLEGHAFFNLRHSKVQLPAVHRHCPTSEDSVFSRLVLLTVNHVFSWQFLSMEYSEYASLWSTVQRSSRLALTSAEHVVQFLPSLASIPPHDLERTCTLGKDGRPPILPSSP